MSYEENRKALFAAIEKPLNEIVGELERRQRGADERLDRCRGATERMLETLLAVQWQLKDLSLQLEVFDRLPEEWKTAIKSMRTKLKDTEVAVKSLRDRDGW